MSNIDDLVADAIVAEVLKKVDLKSLVEQLVPQLIANLSSEKIATKIQDAFEKRITSSIEDDLEVYDIINEPEVRDVLVSILITSLKGDKKPTKPQAKNPSKPKGAKQL